MNKIAQRAFAVRVLAFLVLAILSLAATAAAKKTPPSKPVDVNTAGVEQLAQVPGIGPDTAKAIIRFREKSGPFQRVEDLLAIRGISQRKLDRIRPYVRVASPPRPRT